MRAQILNNLNQIVENYYQIFVKIIESTINPQQTQNILIIFVVNNSLKNERDFKINLADLHIRHFSVIW